MELIAGWAVDSKIGLTGEDWWLEFILAMSQRTHPTKKAEIRHA
ncbi:hypothetical protein HMPREF0623_1572 [Pediococcus acidilactici DSM 20284]|uniref:Uncharacterized protein n=1 Tax=Pediococcus acidilactici DSM 20284 TaxID=862514 RepID=E0NHP9_PEDAC|nr:hypothetical protein HMPREF0623_1572 [Pediococcus acidilactici DSM 20284]